MKAFRWLGHLLFPLLLVLWLNGLVLRLTVRDSIASLAPLYYATPWPVLAALTLPLVWRVRRQPWMVFGGIVLAHVFLGIWLMREWRAGLLSREAAELRVVHWNVARPVSRFAAIAERVRRFDADLIAIAEALPRDETGRERWEAAFDGYHVEFTPGEMLCLVRGEVLARESGVLAYGSYYSWFDARIKGRELRVLQVDVSGLPSHPRRPPLLKIAELAGALKDRPLVVLGDFNTPRDSVHFAALRKGLVNAFEAAGSGCGETWPMPLPVLSLDQIWCGSGLVPVRCWHVATLRSDHRAVVAELRLGE